MVTNNNDYVLPLFVLFGVSKKVCHPGTCHTYALQQACGGPLPVSSVSLLALRVVLVSNVSPYGVMGWVHTALMDYYWVGYLPTTSTIFLCEAGED